MPKITREASPKEIKSGNEYLHCYASGMPFTLHLVWSRYNDREEQVAASRGVCMHEAQELLDLPANKHLIDAGFRVENRTYPVFVQDTGHRRQVEFGRLDKDISFYRQDFYPEGTYINTEHRFYKLDAKQGKYILDSKIFDIPEDEKVWLW